MQRGLQSKLAGSMETFCLFDDFMTKKGACEMRCFLQPASPSCVWGHCAVVGSGALSTWQHVTAGAPEADPEHCSWLLLRTPAAAAAIFGRP